MCMPKRRGDQLFGVEREVLDAAHRIALSGDPYFHGYQATLEIRRVRPEGDVTAPGSIYRALDRLTKLKLLERQWEDPAISEQEGRPRRRLYRLTSVGAASRGAAVDQNLGTAGPRHGARPATESSR